MDSLEPLQPSHEPPDTSGGPSGDYQPLLRVGGFDAKMNYGRTDDPALARDVKWSLVAW